MTYSDKLRDPRWQRKRLEVFDRDGWQCTNCKNSEITLHVHHKVYEQGKDPWEYDNDSLVTLCEDCHKQETKNPDFEMLKSLFMLVIECTDAFKEMEKKLFKQMEIRFPNEFKTFMLWVTEGYKR